MIITVDNVNKTYKNGSLELQVLKNIVGDNIIVTSGLNVGEILIVTPDNRLSDGLVLTEGDNPNSSKEEAAAVPADEAEVVVN